MIIPKKIHQIWFQGEDNIDEEYNRSRQTILNGIYNTDTDWQYEFWDETRILKLLEIYPIYLELYNYYPYMIQKIDLAKYVILYHHGGVYIDMDMDWVKDFYDIIMSNDQIIISKLKQIPFYNNGIILSNERNKFWIDYINYLSENKKRKWYYTKFLYVQYTTGPIAFTVFINKYKKENNGIRILDPKYFEPCISKYKCEITDDTRLKNNFGNSWMPPFEKGIIFLYTYINYVILIIFIIILFFI